MDGLGNEATFLAHRGGSYLIGKRVSRCRGVWVPLVPLRVFPERQALAGNPLSFVNDGAMVLCLYDGLGASFDPFRVDALVLSHGEVAPEDDRWL